MRESSCGVKSMKRVLLATVFVIAAFMIVPAQEQEKDETTVVLTEQQAAALVELEKAEQAYDANKYTVAQRHAERVFELDPANRDGLIIIARSIRKALSRQRRKPCQSC